ncbi:MAG: hypothetical protein Ta2B_10870 [Termitinemataceae bacterium]|nr:MAG: hypothetical protein Ta2B_10870 [Termitinemataceae bacterium]
MSKKISFFLLFLVMLFFMLSCETVYDSGDQKETAPSGFDNLSTREYLAILKSEENHKSSIDEIVALCGLFVASESKARSVDSVAKITNVAKIPTYNEKQFYRNISNARSVGNNTAEEEPIELYVITTSSQTGEDNTGYILASNDDRIGNILAIVDEGAIDDSKNPFTAVFNMQLTDYIDNTIEEYNSITEEEIISAIDKLSQIDRNARTISAHFGNVGDDYKATGRIETDFTKKVDALIKTKWGQGYPYNYYVDYRKNIENGMGYYVTGCVQTAMAQLIVYYGGRGVTMMNAPPRFDMNAIYGNPFVKGIWNGTYNWDFLSTYSMSNTVLSDSSNVVVLGSVQALMYQLGLLNKAKYYDGLTTAYASEAVKTLKNTFGYYSDGASGFQVATTVTETNSTATITYKNNSKTLVQQKLNNGHPILISANSADGKKKAVGSSTGTANVGHMWIIDGYGTLTYYKEYLKRQSNGLNYTYNITFNNCMMVHCNLGWDGDADGWYIYGIFDTAHVSSIDGLVETGIGYSDYSNDVQIWTPYH